MAGGLSGRAVYLALLPPLFPGREGRGVVGALSAGRVGLTGTVGASPDSPAVPGGRVGDCWLGLSPEAGFFGSAGVCAWMPTANTAERIAAMK